jgi:hypothetical protein
MLVLEVFIRIDWQIHARRAIDKNDGFRLVSFRIAWQIHARLAIDKNVGFRSVIPHRLANPCLSCHRQECWF